jgi:hypothetical protein
MMFNRKPPPWAVALAAQLTEIQEEIKTLKAAAPKLPAADVSFLQEAISDLQLLAPPERTTKMSSPTPNPVQIDQNDLTNFANEISAAVAVIGPYIQQLLAGQSVTLAPADESAVQAAITSLQNLEPPAPTPTPSS